MQACLLKPTANAKFLVKTSFMSNKTDSGVAGYMIKEGEKVEAIPVGSFSQHVISHNGNKAPIVDIIVPNAYLTKL